jgi:two-component system chemotaxis response regulator CheB
LIEDTKTIALSDEDQVLFSRPSIDVAFESAAEVWGKSLIGIILTGANHDGAQGLKAVAAAGGTVIVQDPDGAYAGAMPQAALAACPQAFVLPVDSIASYLQGIAA